MLDTFTVTVTMKVQADNAVGAAFVAYGRLPCHPKVAVLQPDGETLEVDLDQDVHVCENCGSMWHTNDLEIELGDIKRLYERIEPGGMVPSGECPGEGCGGALVYPAGAYERNRR